MPLQQSNLKSFNKHPRKKIMQLCTHLKRSKLLYTETGIFPLTSSTNFRSSVLTNSECSLPAAHMWKKNPQHQSHFFSFFSLYSVCLSKPPIPRRGLWSWPLGETPFWSLTTPFSKAVSWSWRRNVTSSNRGQEKLPDTWLEPEAVATWRKPNFNHCAGIKEVDLRWGSFCLLFVFSSHAEMLQDIWKKEGEMDWVHLLLKWLMKIAKYECLNYISIAVIKYHGKLRESVSFGL